MDLKKAISEIRSQLSWDIKEEEKGDFFSIDSNPISKVHSISWPSKDSQFGEPTDIEVLHELVHALFVEKIHPLFSDSHFKRGTPEHWAQAVGCACYFATDWFVDHRIFELVPEEKKEEIRMKFEFLCESIKEKPPSGDLFSFISTGLLIAQAIKYLGMRIQTSGKLKEVVDAFLSTDPSDPTIERLEQIVNKIIKVYSPLCVRLVKEGEFEVWEIVRRE